MKSNFQEFKLAAEYAPIHIIFTDLNGTILYANKAVEEVTGYYRSEIIGNNPRLWGRQMPPEFYKKLWKTIKKDKKVFRGEIKNRRKNGELYIALARIAPALDRKGNLAGFVGIEQDITKEKQVDEAKSEFVNLASHELKNPLSVIYLYAEMLLKEKLGKLHPKQKKSLQKIIRANKKMINLINSLLNVSKIELGKFINESKIVNLSKITKDVIKEFKPKMEEKEIIIEEKYSGKNSVLIDPKMLEIILQNLISNAVKYTPKLGRIKVEVDVRGEKWEDGISEVGSGNRNQKSKNLTSRSQFAHPTSHILIKVSDTGYGIPKKDQGRIFEKMYRASNVLGKDQEGTGLGLYMIKSLINQKNGKIWFSSKRGQGTTFYVEIPLSKRKL